MRNRHRKCAAFLAAILTAGMNNSVCIAAENTYGIVTEYSAEKSKLHIYGTVNGGRYDFLNVRIIPDGATDDNNSIYFSIESDDCGKIDRKVTVSDETAQGRYDYIINDTSMIKKYIIVKVDAEKILSDLAVINKADEKKIEELIISNAEGYALADDDFREYSGELSRLIFLSKPENGYDTEGFVRAYMQAEAILKLKAGKITADDVFGMYGLWFDEGEAKIYESFTDKQEQAFTEIVEKRALDNGNTELINDILFTSRIKGSPDGDIKEILFSWFIENSIDTAAFDRITNDYYKDEVIAEVYRNRSSYIKAEDIEKAFKNACAEIDESNSSSSGNSSGAGSSGGSKQGLGGISNISSLKPVGNSVFNDISEHWAYRGIMKMYELDVLGGYEDGTFRPNGAVTRAEFVTMVARAFGLRASADSGFSDVPAGRWYSRYVAAAEQAGIVSGYMGEFKPDDNITREDMAVIVCRVIDYTKKQLPQVNEIPFSDSNSISQYARNSVARLNNAKLMQGADGYYRPQDNATRAEAAIVLLNAYEFKGMMVKDTDNNESLEETGKALKDDSRNRTAERVTEYIYGGKLFADGVGVNSFTDAAKYCFDGIKADIEDEDTEITVEEAIKIVLGETGYDYFEKLHGTPVGTALHFGLLEGVTQGYSDKLTAESAKLIIYNMLCENVIEIDMQKGSTAYSIGEETFLERLGIYETEGVINKTQYNSLALNDVTQKGRYVQVEGNDFECDFITYDMLGKNIEGYYDEETNRLISITEKNNKETTITAEGIKGKSAFSDGYLRYEENGKNKSLKLDRACVYIYNGRRVKAIDDVMFSDPKTKVRLLDNNSDSQYDLVFIDKYEYIKVGTIDVNNMTVGSQDGIIDLKKAEVSYIISDVDGKSLEIFELGRGSYLKVKRSKDNLLVNAAVVNERISGMVESVDREKHEVNINGKCYTFSDTFMKDVENITLVGLNGVFLVTEDDTLVARLKVTDGYIYGFAFKLWCDEIEGETYLRIFNELGEVQTYECSEKVMIDGGNKLRAEEIIYHKESSTPQLIRFKTDSEGRINAIDTAEISNGVLYREKNVNDSLEQFSHSGDMLYKQNPMTFAGKFNIASTKIFSVPNDVTYAEGYNMLPASDFINDSNYDVVAYNVDEGGTAEAVVVKGNSGTSVTITTRSFVVTKVIDSVNSDLDKGMIVRGWENGGFTEYFVPDDVAVKKASKRKLEKGDIARFKLDRKTNEVCDCIVDFDVSTFADNSAAGGVSFNVLNSALTYKTGKVYSEKNGYICISGKETSEGYDFTQANIVNVKLPSADIVVYDTETGDLRPIKADEIKTFIDYGEDADYAVVRQERERTGLMVLYR